MVLTIRTHHDMNAAVMATVLPTNLSKCWLMQYIDSLAIWLFAKVQGLCIVQ